jgi:hypothetical protein
MAPPQELPYSQTLSALRKADLIRLSVEFKLAVDGPVTTLRNRLRVYLNSHRNSLYPNPRYKNLYPKRHNTTQPSPSPPPENLSQNSRSTSPHNNHSDASWNGIRGQPSPHHSSHPSPHSSPHPTAPGSRSPPPVPHPEPGSPPAGDHTNGGRKSLLPHTLIYLPSFPTHMRPISILSVPFFLYLTLMCASAHSILFWITG